MRIAAVVLSLLASAAFVAAVAAPSALDCKECGNKGKVTCSECQGKKKYDKTCKECAGQGRVPVASKLGETKPCGFCNATGTLKDQKCSACGGSGETACPACSKKSGGRAPAAPEKCTNSDCKLGKVTCSQCGGKGRLDLACPPCGGKGRVELRTERGTKVLSAKCDNCQSDGVLKNATCPTCHRSGLMNCETCEGYGTMPKMSCPNKCRNGSMKCTECNGAQSVKVPCTFCGGKGLVRPRGDVIGDCTEPCKNCNQEGVHKKKCPTCKGVGRIKCDLCTPFAPEKK